MAYDSLHDRLRGPIRKVLMKELGITNVHALPAIEKVVVNVGINKSKMDSKEMQAYIQESMRQITGQNPVMTKARAAISNFKIRENNVVGAMVTLRGQQMETFLDRLISYALPRIRDFRGLPVKLDGHGNYAIGLRDHSVFPEVPPADAKQIFGLQIQITTTTDNDEHARLLLKQIGMPFRPEKPAEEVKDEEKPAEPKAEEEKKTDDSVETEEKTDDTTPPAEAESDSSGDSSESEADAPAADEAEQSKADA